MSIRRQRMGARRFGAVAATSLVLAASTVITLESGSIAQAATPPPCGALQLNSNSPPAYNHVVVLMEENLSFSAWNNATSATAYTHRIAAQCASATDFSAATHPSQPNYVAATSGIKVATALVKVNNENVFHQLDGVGKTWRTYEESMGSNCQKAQTAFYKPGHNPAYWYNDIATTTCKTRDVPMTALDGDIAADHLPAYSWITPNECHDFYWVSACSTPQSAKVRTGDTWLSTFLPRLLALPSYQSGHTLILITWDEGVEGHTGAVDCADPTYFPTDSSCHIPTIALSAYVTPGTRDTSFESLYSLSGTVQDILAVPRTARAVGAGSLRHGMRF